MNDRPLRDDPHPHDKQNDADSLPENATGNPPDTSLASARAFDELLAESSRQIGPYKLLQEIGVGGMGAVWLADQERPVRRRVAVKLIKAGRADKQIIARFEAERQALTMMDHPNIAKVLDAGTAEGGTPYFVMELVQGEPITKYCDRHKLSPHERLKLFVPICDAIQHAHQKGIIHRDLKPSNVLVHVDDDKPVAKVIDFGLAKALQHQTKLTDKTIFTEFGQIVGTVQYMSPEQARTDAIDVDTRTDIYSLGVVLYELMTGSTPLDEDTISQNAVLQLLEIIREKEPPRPSQRLSASSERLSSISEQRKIQPTKLQQILRGDLDWVIMKSLEKDRTRRYATPNDFADDIRRYLDGDAVEARPPTTGYRVRKFIRKNRTLVATVALFMAMLTAGIAGTTSFAIKANRSRQQAEASRIEAEKSAKRSNDVLKIVTDSFQSVDPASGSDANMSAKDVLQKANESLATSELDEEGRRALLGNLTTCLMGIGEYESAIETSKQALDLTRTKLGEDHPDTLKSMFRFASAHFKSMKTDEAIRLFRSTLEGQAKQLGDDHHDTLITMYYLAGAYYRAGKVYEAIALFEKAIPKMKSQLGEDDQDTINASGNLAAAYMGAARYDESIKLYENAIRIQTSKDLADHPSTLTFMNGLAMAYNLSGRKEDAASLAQEVASIMKTKLGETHPYTLAAMGNLAVMYDEAGRRDEAITVFEELIPSMKATLGEDHINTLRTTTGLATAYRDAGRHDEAIELFTKALAKMKATVGEDHPYTTTTMARLGKSYADVKRTEEAIAMFKQAYTLQKATLKEEHPDRIGALNRLAWALAMSDSRDSQIAGNFADELLDDLRSAYRIRDDAYQLQTLAAAEYRSSNFQKVIDLLQPSLDDENHSPIDVAVLAMSHFQLGDKKEAAKYRERLDDLMHDEAFKDDDVCMSFAAEVSELLGRSDSDPATINQ